MSSDGENSSAMVGMSDLPDELLLRIFALLSLPDIALAVAQVCIRWHRLAQDQVLWRRLQLVVEKGTDRDSVLQLLPHLPQLTNLKLQWRRDVEDIVDAMCAHCPRIVRLELVCCGYFREEYCVERLVQYQETLTSLSLGKCWAVSKRYLDGIKMFRNLTELNLSHSMLTCGEFKSISVNCAKIVSLNIDYVRGITEEDLIMFLNLREDQLNSLVVFGELLTNSIFAHLEKCQRLKVLHISTCRNFSDDCFLRINKLSKLKSLTLRKAIRITSKTLSDFYFESRIVKNLNYLYISAKRIVTKQDIEVWPKNYVVVDQNLVDHFCTCVLTKEGFTIF